MTQMAFDTLAYAKTLVEAGMDSNIAEAQAEAQAKILGGLMQDKLVSKEDLREGLTEQGANISNTIIEFDDKLSKQIAEVDKRLSDQIAEVDKRLSDQIAEVDKRLSGQIAELDKKLVSLQADIGKLRSEMRALESRMVVKLGSLMMLGLGVMVILLKLFHM